MKVAIFWGGAHTLPGKCDENTWYSFYNSGWRYGFESLGHQVDWFAYEDLGNYPGYDLYIYAPGFLTHLTMRDNLHHPNIFFTEELGVATSWAINHSYYFDHVCFMDYMNWSILHNHLGIQNVHWVPPAVDPTVFKDLTQPRDNNCSFLGNYDDTIKILGKNQTRKTYIQAIDAHNHPSSVARGFYAFEANKVWNNTKIGVDVPLTEFFSFRNLQIIAAGALCITRKVKLPSGVEHLLKKDEYITYNDLDHLIFEVLPYWIEHEKLRNKVIEKAKMNVLANHTFKNRAEQILEIYR